MKTKDQIQRLPALLFLALVVAVTVADSQVPDITGTWDATFIGANGTDKLRWELRKGRAITPDHHSWGITRTLIETTDEAKRSLRGTTEYVGSIEYRGGTFNYRVGSSMFVQSGTCSLTGDTLNCTGKETLGLANGREFDFTIVAARVGPAPKTTSDPAKQERLPVIFLPGVAGTGLSFAETFSGYRGTRYSQVWPLDDNQKREHLELLEDGRTPKLAARGRSISVGEPLSSWPTNFYGGLRDFLREKGYPSRSGNGSRLYFEFPYDWRLSNDTHHVALDKLIDEALKQNPNAKKVVLLAHSMGGVIARHYLLSSNSRAMRVDKLITMGTPYWGAPKPYYGAISGYTFGNPSVKQPLMKILQQNWPAGYQLMPAYEFVYDLEKKRYLTLNESNRVKYKWTVLASGMLRDTGLASYQESPGNVLGFNRGLVSKAELFRSSFGTPESPVPLPLNIPHYVIIGTGIRTLAFFDMRDAGPTERHLELDGRKVVMFAYFKDGDGTVPLEGSQLSKVTATYYIPYVEKWGYDSSSGHGDLPANATVQKIVAEILEGNPPAASDHPYKSGGLCANNQGRYSTTHLNCEKLIDLEPGVDLTLRSDAYLNIKDVETRRELGYKSDGSIVEDLPSGSFIAMDGVERASIADVNRPLDVTVNGLRDGKFTLEINIVRPDGQLKKFAYQQVVVKNGTVAQVGFTPGLAMELPDLTVTTGGAIQMVKAVELPADRPLLPRRGGTQIDSSNPFLGTIPAVGGTVTAFRFFTTNEDIPPPQGAREYQTRFSRATLGTVYYEFSVKYLMENPANFTMVSTWSRGQTPIVRQELPVAKPANWNTSTRSYGYGSREPGKWEPGTYTVKVEVEGQKVAEGSFVVY